MLLNTLTSYVILTNLFLAILLDPVHIYGKTEGSYAIRVRIWITNMRLGFVDFGLRTTFRDE